MTECKYCSEIGTECDTLPGGGRIERSIDLSTGKSSDQKFPNSSIQSCSDYKNELRKRSAARSPEPPLEAPIANPKETRAKSGKLPAIHTLKVIPPNRSR